MEQQYIRIYVGKSYIKNYIKNKGKIKIPLNQHLITMASKLLIHSRMNTTFSLEAIADGISGVAFAFDTFNNVKCCENKVIYPVPEP